MRWTEHPVGGIAHHSFEQLKTVRLFRNSTVSSATRQGRPVLVIHDLSQRKLIVCEYDSEQERAEDIGHLFSL